MSKVSDISSENGKWLKWKATSVEWLAVIIACAASMMALVSMFVVAICVGIIWSQENRIDELEGEVETYSNRTIRFESWLKSKGIPEEIEDE